MPFTKLRTEWESKYVSEYVLQKYPHDEVQFRCPLGKVPESMIKELGLSKATGAYRPYRPEVDARVITDDALVLIEGKIFKVMDGLSKLPVYRSLVKETPELELYKNFPVRAVLVTPKELTWGANIAVEQNIEVELFLPGWLDEYYAQQEGYWTAEERYKREQRKNVLKGLGFK
jgi:hypothetical protein